MRAAHKIAFTFLAIFLMQSVHANTRECAVSGSFYSKDETKLSRQISSLLENAKEFETKTYVHL